MSVPKSRRERSSAEFLHVARELRLHTIRKCVGFPKRYTFYVSQQLADCATRARDEAKMANSIYPTNRHEAQLRIDHLLEARAAVQALVSHVEEADELFGDAVPVQVVPRIQSTVTPRVTPLRQCDASGT